MTYIRRTLLTITAAAAAWGAMASPARLAASIDPKGSPRVLVILAAYADMPFKGGEQATATFTEIMSQAADYFAENSSGCFTPIIDVVGPVTLPQGYAWYGAPNGNEPDSHQVQMIIDACQAADELTNFSQYDNDGDGTIDNVYVFYAGQGQSDGGNANTVWPHSSFIHSRHGLNVTLDGCLLDRYACSAEISGVTARTTGIGTFCHEFGHVLGLPDLYPTHGNSQEHPAQWSLMALGVYNDKGYTPPYLTAYERYVLGWIEPKVVRATDELLTLAPIAQNEAYIIKTTRSDEYFLIENRQQQGRDAFVPGHGMLVWHIDYNDAVWNAGAINDNAAYQHVDIEEADGTCDNGSRGGDTFPGEADVRSITDDTTPSLIAWDGTRRRIGLFNIDERADGTIAFNALSTAGSFTTPSALEAIVTARSLTLSWSAVDGAADYVVDVADADGSWLQGYRLRHTGTDCKIEITGLTPESDYTCSVRAIGSGMMSEAVSKVFRTDARDFSMLAPTALEATDITSTGFTAHWLPMDGADRYAVTVTAIVDGDNYVLSNDFTGNVAAPVGWATDCSQFYAASGYFGAAAPALMANRDRSYVMSPICDDRVDRISFWYKGTSSQSAANAIEVSGFDYQGQWQSIATVRPVLREASGSTVTIGREMLSGIYRAIRIEYVRPSSGTLALDDISVTHVGDAEAPIESHTAIDAADALEFVVTGLSSDSRYLYRVVAYNGAIESLASEPIAVTTSADHGAASDITTNTLQVSTLGAGKIAISGISSGTVRLIAATGAMVRTVEASEELTLDGITPGIYIVTATTTSGTEVVKVAVP